MQARKDRAGEFKYVEENIIEKDQVAHRIERKAEELSSGRNHRLWDIDKALLQNKSYNPTLC